jgi:hypothetical protein
MLVVPLMRSQPGLTRVAEASAGAPPVACERGEWEGVG